MTTAPLSGPARVPTPRPKAPAADSAAALNQNTHANVRSPPSASAPAARSGTPIPPPPSDGPAPSQATAGYRRGGRPSPSDPLSDKATLFLIRRTLCPQHVDKGRNTPAPIEDVLPPLTSRNDVDLQLYALLAIILREYVQNWYGKITPDETFVAEMIQIIAHITRALEQQLRKVDLESLLFDEIPDLLDRHITAYRAAQNPIARPPVQSDSREIYHSTCPLPALSPVPKAKPKNASTIAEQAENEAAYRQLLVQGVLAILLPTEDLENDCLTALVGQIFSELIIGNLVANKLSQPWMIWECLIILSRAIGRRNTERGPRPSERDLVTGGSFSIRGLFLSVVQWCFTAATFVRFLVTTAILSSSLPSRLGASGPARKVTRRKSDFADDNIPDPDPDPDPDYDYADADKVPFLAFRSWAAISNLIELDARMPWLSGALSMLQWMAMTGPGRIADVDGILDRLLSHYVHRHVLDPAGLPSLLRSVRGALFPNNMPGQSTLVAPSSDAELRALRRRCANALWTLVPKRVGSLYLGGGFLKPNHNLARTAGNRTARTGPSHDGIRSADVERGDAAQRGSPGFPSTSQLSLSRSGPEYRSGLTSGSADGAVRDKKQTSSQVQNQIRSRDPQAQSRSEILSSKQSSSTSGRHSGGDAAVGTSSGTSQRGAPTQPPNAVYEQQAAVFAHANRHDGDGGVANQAHNSSRNRNSGDLAVGDGGRQSGEGHGRRDQDHHSTDSHQSRTGLDSDPSRIKRQDADGPASSTRDEEEGHDHDPDHGQILAEIENGILDVFGDAYCNKHLMYSVVELVLVRLMPELAEHGVVELLEERL